MTMNFGNGQFDYISNEDERAMLSNAHRAVSRCDLWGKLRTLNSYLFLSANFTEFTLLLDTMCEDPIGKTHSGHSFMNVLRVMEYIAKNGDAAFRELYLANPK